MNSPLASASITQIGGAARPAPLEMLKTNPLVADTQLETVQNVSEALTSLAILLAHEHSDLVRLMSPMIRALEYEANRR